ncbi:3-oxoacyl-reductase 4 [Triangularia verruculosa]|uniref:3-oxoacyl-reductase 4 n=1 Tax=Triangularia verruculosa TaxID=2587418 RepID=A0AAN6X8I3_9PEZI|nr:3-oxoacyl-reductase 4 [Triangularia verruculosa]
MASTWDDFVIRQDAQALAQHMLKDAALLDDGGSPSPLAMHLPPPHTPKALEIATHLTSSVALDIELKRFMYGKILARLRKASREGQCYQEPPLPPDGYLLVSDLSAIALPSKPRLKNRILFESFSQPTEEEVKTTLRVLHHLQLATSGEPADSIDQVAKLVESHFEQSQSEFKNASHCSWSEDAKRYLKCRPPTRPRVCYICRYLLHDPHPVYKSMCRPCGVFNYAGSALSLPQSLQLSKKTALVTGARVNLGYHVALRLLRCGTLVMATTRYPNNAALRYSQEPDFEEWKDRLKVIGADFRTARDAFALVKAVKSALDDWGALSLTILVNNAAQTLTDSVKKEERAVAQENREMESATSTNIIFQSAGHASYQARVRGGVLPLSLSEDHKPVFALQEAAAQQHSIVLPDNVKDDGRTELAEPYFKSSWVQSLSEIPYEDVVSAHSVNAFVPLILCRELLPLMGSAMHITSSSPPQNSYRREPEQKSRTGQSKRERLGQPTRVGIDDVTHRGKGRKPLGYIVNVSSREGVFENETAHAVKNGAHVHTNMTKAAINMITQTEAATAWKMRSVVMNTVDPGYMSAAPEMDGVCDGERPLLWEDGAGRVLWPVAIGEVEGTPVWGRFLKHYGAVDVDSDLQR